MMEVTLNFSRIFMTAGVFILMCSPASAEQRMKVSSTTSLDNTGLLAAILPSFQEKTGIRVDVIAVGTGKALKLGENGDVDAVFVHDPASEEAFMKAGYGKERTTIMSNYFIIAGPSDDPAGVRKAKTAQDAFKRIKTSSAIFISRGDNSGTNLKELEIWKSIPGGQPKNSKWYLESGKGMEEALLMADEKQAYILTDEATFLKLKKSGKFVSLFSKRDPALKNIYSFITLNTAKNPSINSKAAEALLKYLLSPEAQDLIAKFKDSEGHLLFTALTKTPDK